MLTPTQPVLTLMWFVLTAAWHVRTLLTSRWQRKEFQELQHKITAMEGMGAQQARALQQQVRCVRMYAYLCVCICVWLVWGREHSRHRRCSSKGTEWLRVGVWACGLLQVCVHLYMHHVPAHATSIALQHLDSPASLDSCNVHV